MQHNYKCKSESFVLFDIFLSWRNEKNHNKQKKDFLASYSPLLLLIVGNYMERWNQHPAWVWKPLSVHGMWISLLSGHDTSRSGEVDSTWVNTPLKRRIWCAKNSEESVGFKWIWCYPSSLQGRGWKLSNISHPWSSSPPSFWPSKDLTCTHLL